MSHDVEDLVRIFVKMRDKKSALTSEYEAAKKELEAKMERVEGALLNCLNTNGVESMRTTSGTAYKTIKVKPSIKDFSALRAWILETGNIDILQKRISTTALADGGETPPGVEIIREAEVTVRRS